MLAMIKNIWEVTELKKHWLNNNNKKRKPLLPYVPPDDSSWKSKEGDASNTERNRHYPTYSPTLAVESLSGPDLVRKEKFGIGWMLFKFLFKLFWGIFICFIITFTDWILSNTQKKSGGCPRYHWKPKKDREYLKWVWENKSPVWSQLR